LSLSRRAFLAGGVGAAALAGAAAAVPGVREQLLGPPQPPHPVPTGPVGELVQEELESAALRRRVGVGIAYPEAVVEGLPVLLVLHGRGNGYTQAFGSHHLGAFLSDAVRGGVPPFAVVAADGGKNCYWHPRADGTNALRMLVDELLPMLAKRGLQVERFAVGGWSMGGYGALLLSEVLGPARIAACVPDSPALFRRWADTSQGSFDDRRDFELHDVLTHSARLAGIPLRVTCGTSDPFIGGVRELVRQVPSAERQLEPGGHDPAWWLHVAPQQLAFAGRHLAQTTT
jgi:pimeloyl-ACP methyl ester carboxylesterase